MNEPNDHSDMIPYVIAFVIGVVVINVLFRLWRDSWVYAIEKATGLNLFN